MFLWKYILYGSHRLLHYVRRVDKDVVFYFRNYQSYKRMWLSSKSGIEIFEDQVLRINSSKKEILRPRVTWSLVAWWRELWELKYKKDGKVSDKKMTEQRRKSQAYHSCVERIPYIMYKTQCSMKRNDFQT